MTDKPRWNEVIDEQNTLKHVALYGREIRLPKWAFYQMEKEIYDLKELLDVERLASLIHDEWISWSKTLAEKSEVTPEKAKAWEQYWVPYEELSEEVKEMDREWAYKVIGVEDGEN